MNMFKKSKATNSKEYFASLPEDRKDTILYLDKLIRKTVPSLKPNFIYNMPGYGTFQYTNYKKQEAEWPVIALANQKNYISLYVCGVHDGKYIAEEHADKLGKVSVGKSCIRFKKLEDIDEAELKKVLKIAEKSPGLVGAGEHKKK